MKSIFKLIFTERMPRKRLNRDISSRGALVSQEELNYIFKFVMHICHEVISIAKKLSSSKIGNDNKDN